MARKHVKADGASDVDDQIGPLRGGQHDLTQVARRGQSHTVQRHDIALNPFDRQREDPVGRCVNHSEPDAVALSDLLFRQKGPREISHVAAVGDTVHIGVFINKRAIFLHPPV